MVQNHQLNSNSLQCTPAIGTDNQLLHKMFQGNDHFGIGLLGKCSTLELRLILEVWITEIGNLEEMIPVTVLGRPVGETHETRVVLEIGVEIPGTVVSLTVQMVEILILEMFPEVEKVPAIYGVDLILEITDTCTGEREERMREIGDQTHETENTPE